MVVDILEVILADYLGFCYGVKRAITIARENASADGTACTLGPIIHNPQMVERLKREGVGSVDRLDELRHGTVIIRSHGVGPQVYDEAERRGLGIVDATCPHVKKHRFRQSCWLRKDIMSSLLANGNILKSRVFLNGQTVRQKLLKRLQRLMH